MAKFSVSDLNVWYDEFNARYFNNELKRCPIYINKAKRCLGIFTTKQDWFGVSVCIKISNYLDRPIKDVQNTLIHEMVHQWQWIKFRKCDHGTTFKNKAYEINKDGWNIQRCNSTDGCEVNNVNPNKIYNVCIFKKHNTFCKAVLASNKVDNFKKWIPTINGVTEVYFGFSRDKRLAKYTCSRTRLTWYSISEEEFNALTTRLAPLAKNVA